jgi:acyl dehydratase
MPTFSSVEDLKAAVGQELGVSDWYDVTQERVDAFADATGDHQWIHVDPERAKDSPFGGTIAHGLFTLSLGPGLRGDTVDFSGFAAVLNYGYGKVRFPAPVPIPSRVRLRTAITDVQEVPGGVQVTIAQTFEREGGDKPVCVAEQLARAIIGR